MSITFEKRILSQVLWSFSRRFDDRSSFDAAVRRYHLDIVKSDERWRPEALVVPCQMVRVHFEYWELEPTEREVEETLALKTEHAAGFTALELLFQIHREVTTKLAPMDRKFFEGLSLRSADTDGVPFYWLSLGS